MEDIVSNILNYIAHIRKQYSLSITFHMTGKYCAIFHNDSKLLPYSIHKSPYCIKIKSTPSGRRRCTLCQYLTVKKCRETPHFIGSCHADVCEYIQGVRHNGKYIGFISVSGYKSGTRRKAKDSELLSLYNSSTKAAFPDEQLLNAIIPPLQRMIEFYIENFNFYSAENSTEYFRILSYINENYYDISLDKLCSHFNYSKSYISHTFKRINGQSIRRYATGLKLRDAKMLLKTTSMPITDIALMTGFNEVSYFVNTFKRLENESPAKYRKRHQSNPK